jgi:hypothetical protein
VARTIARVNAGPVILAILSLPAAAIGYVVSRALLSSLPLPSGLADLVLAFVPLLIAGLCMVPFIAPLLDRQAKRDLEAHRARSAASQADPTEDSGKRGA